MFFLYYKLPHFEYIAVWIVAFGKIAKWYHFTNFLLKVTCFPTSIKISVLVWLTAKYVFLQREFHCETRFPTKQISPQNEFFHLHPHAPQPANPAQATQKPTQQYPNTNRQSPLPYTSPGLTTHQHFNNPTYGKNKHNNPLWFSLQIHAEW